VLDYVESFASCNKATPYQAFGVHLEAVFSSALYFLVLAVSHEISNRDSNNKLFLFCCSVYHVSHLEIVYDKCRLNRGHSIQGLLTPLAKDHVLAAALCRYKQAW
jgi:hypothetical protein